MAGWIFPLSVWDNFYILIPFFYVRLSTGISHCQRLTGDPPERKSGYVVFRLCAPWDNRAASWKELESQKENQPTEHTSSSSANALENNMVLNDNLLLLVSHLYQDLSSQSLTIFLALTSKKMVFRFFSRYFSCLNRMVISVKLTSLPLSTPSTFESILHIPIKIVFLNSALIVSRDGRHTGKWEMMPASLRGRTFCLWIRPNADLNKGMWAQDTGHFLLGHTIQCSYTQYNPKYIFPSYESSQ